jgi:hypothetical protein
VRKVEVVILAEDIRQQNFARRYVERLGFNMRQVRPLPLPAGRGSGEQYVREKYAAEVEELRRRFTARAGALIVLIDTDTDEIRRRERQLAEALAAEGVPGRGDGETIIHFIPKRHIETWILCLTGETVDEASDYRNRNVDAQIKPATESFYEWTRPNATPPAHCIPSLQAAIPEARRLET